MKACNRKILELFYNAKHTGRVSKPDAIGRVGEDDEGLVIELTWRVIGGVIVEAKFRAFANPNAIAITSLMVDNIIGKNVDEAILIGEDVIIDNLGEFLPEYLEAYDMVREAINEAYNNYLKRQSRKAEDEINNFDYEEYLATHPLQEGEELDIKQLQRELFGEVKVERRGRPRKVVDTSVEEVEGVKRGRGRPRKEIDPNAVVEVGEKRGRGRPRKVVDEAEIVEVGVKRGRGRPRKEIDPNAEEVVVEKRGRGRPRKEIDPNAVVEVGEKRGRGRPRKIVDEAEIVEVGVKRGRGRPRKEVDPNAEEIVVEKRGRGRPRKEIDLNEEVEVGEKRGRGRPRKIVDETEIVEVGEKRGRGRPRKEVKFNLPSDLDDVIGDEEVEQLINGSSHSTQTTTEYSSNDFVNDLVNSNLVEENTVNKLVDEDDDAFDADYDLFKSNIRNILSGKEVSNQNYHTSVKEEVDDSEIIVSKPIEETPSIFNQEQTTQSSSFVTDSIEIGEKRGRGRPRKVVDPSTIVEDGEKRGRGRPRKIVIEEVEDDTVRRGRGRPRVEPINSLTRSLTPNSMPSHTNQDIVFASKNVTTTNININVTKTTTSVEDNKATSDDYSHTTNISQQKVEITLPNNISKDDEIDIDEDLTEQNNIAEVEDFDEEIDTSNIKDEAPSGGIEDLLKALLDD